METIKVSEPNQSITMTIKNVIKISLLITVVLIIAYLNIFESKQLNIMQQQLNRVTVLDIRQTDLECSQKQTSVREHIKEQCSKIQVCFKKSGTRILRGECLIFLKA